MCVDIQNTKSLQKVIWSHLHQDEIVLFLVWAAFCVNVVADHVKAIPAHLRVLNLICHRIFVFCRPCDIRDTRTCLACHGFSALSFAKMLLSLPASRWLRVSWTPDTADTAAPAPGARTAGAASAPPWSWTPCRSSRTGSRPRPGCTRRSSLRASSERKAFLILNSWW